MGIPVGIKMHLSLKRWLSCLLGGMLVTLILSSGGVYLLAWQKSKESESRAWAEYAQASVRQIQSRTQDLSAWLEGLARDPKLLEGLVSGSEVKAAEQRLARIVPAAVQVRILPRTDRWQEAGYLALGFADLDLVHQAETGNPPPAVHGFGAPGRHVALARAIRWEDRVIGVILARVDFAWLQQALPTPSMGAIALYQGGLPLVYRGDTVFQALPPTGTVSIPGTLWQVKYWTPAPRWQAWMGSIFILTVALGLTYLMVWWVLRNYARAIEQDRNTLFTLANDLIAGTVQGDYPLALRELEPLLDRLLQLQRAGLPARASAGKAEPSPEAEPTPVSDIGMQEVRPAPARKTAKVSIPEVLFHFDDIRGHAGDTLTPAIAYELGRAIGSQAAEQGEQSVVVGRDARDSSDALAQAVIEGLRASGRDVIDLGKVPIPIVYFATHYLPVRSGVMVTGGHNPPQDNGFKIVIGQQPWSGEKLKQLQQRLHDGQFNTGRGMLESRDLLADYIGAVIDDVQIGRSLKAIVDCGAGVAAQVAPALLRTLGCEVEECHSPGMLDPLAPRALNRLIARVQKDKEAELGLAFDGDGDRLVVVDASGNLILPDRVLMLLASEVLSREPGGDIVFDVDCSRQLASYVIQHGGRPVVAPSGYYHIRAKMAEVEAVLGGGFSGQIVFQERWFGFADAIYGAARLLEILSAEPLASDEVFARLPQAVATPQLKVELAQAEPGRIMRLLSASADKFFQDARINPIDGVRVDFADGWGLVRASCCVPALVFRFEADDEQALARIQGRFREWFETLELALELPFDASGG